MVRTFKLQLYMPNKEKEEKLQGLMGRQFNCINWFVDKIRENETTSIKFLQEKFYREARILFDLPSDYAELAMLTAIRISRIARGKRKFSPHLSKESLRFINGKIDGNNLGIFTGDRRAIWIPFKSAKFPVGSIRESILKIVDGKWYCFLSILTEDKPVKQTEGFLGVDLGIARIAVVSSETGTSNAFYSGESYRAKRSHYYQLRKRLQPKLKQGNVYKLLKTVSKKESNWIKDANHKISKGIVQRAVEENKAIAMENLTGIRKRVKMNKKTRRMIHSWAFRELASFIEYKARLEGVPYVTVDPRDTSKRCPKCGNISRRNRRSQARFKCTKCHYESNADRVGAMNIAIRATGLGV